MGVRRRRVRLLWGVYSTYLVIILLCVTAVTVYAEGRARNFALTQTAADLQARAWLVERQLAAPGALTNEARLQRQIVALGAVSATRLTVIAPSGRVLADSQHDPATMANHSDRPEFQTAMTGAVGQSVRQSPTQGRKEMYVAVPLRQGSRVVAVVRAALPLTAIDAALSSLRWRIALSALVVALLAAALGFFVSRAIARPLQEMRGVAQRIATGDFTARAPLQGSEEMAGLAGALNTMAAELDERIRQITRQTNEQQAVLSSMLEGVLAVDNEGRVLTINQAAARLLNVDPDSARGRPLQDIARLPEVQDLLRQAARSSQPVEAEVVVHREGEERVLQVHGAVLRGSRGGVNGSLVVLNDVTRLKRLENVRREFVANVSHELKTPVTAIKGFAETLLDGALSEPEDARRFVTIIAAQSDRLNAILEDLLRLSRLEHEDEAAAIAFAPGNVGEVLAAAAAVCAPAAAEKGIALTVSCPDDVVTRMNAPLLEQAVVNLLDNAIKYSGPGASVEARGERVGGRLRIIVRDTGPGIAREHLPHLFERFYRVDKARSRDLGGTGLGLAIVKHVAQVHGGTVTVDSTVGQGSRFTITLPLS